MRRIGRYADGWLGSFRTPAEAAGDVAAIQKAASEAGREIEPDHFGISLAVCPSGLPPELIARPSPTGGRGWTRPPWPRAAGRRRAP